MVDRPIGAIRGSAQAPPANCSEHDLKYAPYSMNATSAQASPIFDSVSRRAGSPNSPVIRQSNGTPNSKARARSENA